MSTGKRLLSDCMPCQYKQGTLYPVNRHRMNEKPYRNSKSKNAGHVRKAGQNKLRKQLKKELRDEVENNL